MQSANDLAEAALDRWRNSDRDRDRASVIGICGAQGSGKSTLAADLAERLDARGLRTAVVSLDDFYFSRRVRQDLARAVHPLFATRGAPGTHDTELGIRLLDDLIIGRTRSLPRFDKADDAPLDSGRWPTFVGPADVVLFEGWCVGARAQAPADLASPLNDLERNDDPQGTWREAVNRALQGPYARWFSRIDRLVLLAAPDFGIVERWRTQQEHALRAQTAATGHRAAHLMSDAAIARFIQHYERLTRSILREMPARADLTLCLDAERNVLSMHTATHPRGHRPSARG